MFGLNIISSGIKFAEAVSETTEAAVTTADTVADTTENVESGKSILSTLKEIATNPITIGIGAATAVAAGSYYGYKAYKKYRVENPKSEINTSSVNPENLKNADEIKTEESKESAN